MRIPALLLAFGLPILATQPLTLADAVASALARHPDLAAAAAAQDAARGRLDLARASRLGTLSTSYQWAPALRNPTFAFPGAPQRLSFDLQNHQLAAVTLDQPLWTWGSLDGRVRAAALEVQGAGAATTREAQAVRFRVTRAYLLALETEAAVAVAESALAQQQAFMAMAQARVRAGSAPRLDVLKADLAVSNAEAGKVARLDEARIAREDLVAEAGDPGFREAVLVPEAPGVPSDAAPEALVAAALARRPDLRHLECQASSLTAAAEAARAAGRPNLNLVGSVAQQNGVLDGLFQGENRTYLLGLAVRWDPLARRRSLARAAESSSEAIRVRAEGRSLADQVTREVRTARLQVEDALAQVRWAAAGVALAEEQARVARLSYREGVTTAVEAQDAELDLTRAKFQALAAGLARDVALAQLAFALGA